MRAATLAIVLAGLAMTLALGLSQGFDATSVTILMTIVLVGALAVAAANRSSGGLAGPATCEECGGVISPNAPFCKHCGTRRAS